MIGGDHAFMTLMCRLIQIHMSIPMTTRGKSTRRNVLVSTGQERLD